MMLHAIKSMFTIRVGYSKINSTEVFVEVLNLKP